MKKTPKPAKAGKRTSAGSARTLPRKHRAAAPKGKREAALKDLRASIAAKKAEGADTPAAKGYLGVIDEKDLPPGTSIISLGGRGSYHPGRIDPGSSKQSQAVALMKEPGGALASTMCERFGWLPHSLRGFVSGTVKTKLGYEVESTKEGGTRRYCITGGGPA